MVMSYAIRTYQKCRCWYPCLDARCERCHLTSASLSHIRPPFWSSVKGRTAVKRAKEEEDPSNSLKITRAVRGNLQVIRSAR